MIYSLPPAPPVQLVYAMAECKKGSRDCFPEDRVGNWQESADLTTAKRDLRTISLLAG
ncbi:MAG TPA: hypothetical protein IGR64_09480 [Leptolyngbyaceae cyanobacterium M65_K2018_010]|nr:hypothetical protein [Leptolyngbyaceae cyanobacterium M65_K2018_010]